ncbi:hypothetical protein V4C53_23255 [Paraburkholderia azotifigens]|uniref:hypothetical protein n=1 Tax=Paraburkholderia azotifigens TaxID=2057004 RepID=UPI00317DE1F3
MKSARVPDDFPCAMPGVVSGAQPKVVVRRTGDGRYTAETQEKRFERWDICEDLAQQLVSVAHKESAKRPAYTRDMTLERIRKAVANKGWISPEELEWLMRRVRTLLE